MNIIEQAKNAGAELYADTLILNGKDCHDFVERFRALVLEEAAKVCDVTPPQPFRPSIEAAHAIRALKGAKE